MTTNALTNYAENAALDHLLGTASWTLPAATYVKFHIGDPGEDATGNPANFTTRTEITDWDTAASQAIANTNALAIPGMTATETISHYSVWDASTAGNPLFIGQLDTSRDVESGDQLDLAAGDLVLDFLSTNLTTYSSNALLEHIVGKTSMTSPTNTYVQMHTGAPGLAGTANVANLSTRTIAGAWGSAVAGATDNDAAILFTGTTTETLSHLSIWDASTAGNALWQGALTASRSVVVSEIIEAAAGAIDSSLL